MYWFGHYFIKLRLSKTLTNELNVNYGPIYHLYALVFIGSLDFCLINENNLQLWQVLHIHQIRYYVVTRILNGALNIFRKIGIGFF